MALLSSASLDGLDPNRYNVAALQQALDAARSGKRKRVEQADQMLSAAFVAYVGDLRQDPGVGINYVDADLKPKPPTPLGALLSATIAPSLSDYVRTMGWMHPLYGQLREALVDHNYSTDEQRQTLELNLKRARVLPRASSATSSSTPPSSGCICMRTASRWIRWSSWSASPNGRRRC